MSDVVSSAPVGPSGGSVPGGPPAASLPPVTVAPLHRDPVLAGLAGLGLLCLVWFGWGIGPFAAHVVTCWLLLTGVHVLLAYTSIRVYRTAPGGRGMRRVWAGIGFAGAAFTLGDVSQLVVIATGPLDLEAATGAPFQLLTVLLGTGGLVLVVLREPVRLADQQERLRYGLDLVVIMSGATTVAMYLYVPRPGSGLVLDFLVGPHIFLVGVFAIAKLLLGVDRPFTAAAGWTIGAAAVLEASLQGATWLQRTHLPWLLGLTVTASLLLAASARIQLLQAGRVLVPSPRRRRFSTLPYAAVAVSNVLLVWVLMTKGVTPRSWIVISGVILSTVLVVVRQIVAFVESGRLLDELDRRIGDLHVALNERDRLAERLQHQAYHDPLTGLGNRALFRAGLDDALCALESGRTERVLLFLIDLDDFKPVNDTHGHAAGDELLVVTGERLRSCLRAEDLVSRLGGDEFAVILTGPGDSADALAERLVEVLTQPVAIGAAVVSVGASIGVVAAAAEVSGRRARSAEDLLRAADDAMYAAKRDGKGGYRLIPV